MRLMIKSLEELREAFQDDDRRAEIDTWFSTIPLYPRGVLWEVLRENESLKSRPG